MKTQTETNQYDMFSQMTLQELIEQEKAAASMLNTSSQYLNEISRKDLGMIRRVMSVVHNYNWLTKKVKA